MEPGRIFTGAWSIVADVPTYGHLLGVRGQWWLLLLIVVASAVFAWRVSQLVRVVLRGKPERRLDRIPERLSLVAREVFAQTRILRGDAIINWAHPLVFWGFCCFVIASTLMLIGGVVNPSLGAGWKVIQAEEIPVLGTVIDVFAVLVLVGLAAASFRRYVLRPPGLQRTWDATLVNGLIAALMITYLLAEAGSMAAEEEPVVGVWRPAGSATATLLSATGLDGNQAKALGSTAWWIHAALLLGFLAYLPYSKHMHLMWAPFTVFTAELDDRKGSLGKPQTDVGASQEGETTDELRPSAFTWRQLLNAYSCAECGRCERSCPANAGGMPLSPRQVIHDFKEFVLDCVPATWSRGNGNGSSGKESRRHEPLQPETVWSCTTCYACHEVCPVRNEHVPLILAFRRRLVEQGQLDATLQEAFVALQRYGNSLGKSSRKRFDWAKGLSAPLVDASREPVDLLWFVGDYAAFHPSAAKVSKAAAEVLQRLGFDFGCLLRREWSAGNDVRRAGEEGLFELLAEHNMEALEKAQFQRIVTTDPHSYHTLKREYNELGLTKPVLHVCELFDEAARAGRFDEAQKISGTAVLHDPCYLGRYHGIYDAPRRVLRALGLQLREMPRHREHSFCCGAGGGQIWMEDRPSDAERPAIQRIREALAMDDITHFVVLCPKDLVMFQDAVKSVGAEDRLRVVDLIELVDQAIPSETMSGVNS